MILLHHLLFGTRYPKTNFNASFNILKERLSLSCHVFSGECPPTKLTHRVKLSGRRRIADQKKGDAKNSVMPLETGRLSLNMTGEQCSGFTFSNLPLN